MAKQPLPDYVKMDGVLWRTMDSAPKHDGHHGRVALYLWDGYQTHVGYWNSCAPTGWIVNHGDYFDMVSPKYWAKVPPVPKGPPLS